MIGQTGCFPQLILVNSIWYIHRKIRFPCPLNVGTVVNSPVMRIPHIISDLRIWTGNLNTQTILFLDHHQTQSPLVMLTHFDENFDLCARRVPGQLLQYRPKGCTHSESIFK